LITLPYFEGERTPVYDPQAKGMLFGLTQPYEADHRSLWGRVLVLVDRKIGEGANQTHHLQQAEPGTGDGCRSFAFVRILKWSFLSRSAPCVFMAEVVWAIKNLEEAKIIKKSTTLKPNPSNVQIYNDYYRIYRQLYEQTKGLMHDLDAYRRV
jgi:xylulokinase